MTPSTEKGAGMRGAVCSKCDETRERARAAGFRDWRKGVCYDHAGVSLDVLQAMIGEDEEGPADG